MSQEQEVSGGFRRDMGAISGLGMSMKITCMDNEYILRFPFMKDKYYM